MRSMIAMSGEVDSSVAALLMKEAGYDCTSVTMRAAVCTVYPLPGDEVRIVFDEPRRAIPPGQAVVLYCEDMVLGGGIIRDLPTGMSE